MKTSDKIWIFIGFFILSMIIGYIIYDTTYLQKTTPKIYNIEQQFNTKDGVLVSINYSYSVILGKDPYKDKEMAVEFLSTIAIHEIICDFYLEDYLQQRYKIVYNINKAITTKVLQKFPNIEFQLIDIEVIVNL